MGLSELSWTQRLRPSNETIRGDDSASLLPTSRQGKQPFRLPKIPSMEPPLRIRKPSRRASVSGEPFSRGARHLEAYTKSLADSIKKQSDTPEDNNLRRSFSFSTPENSIRTRPSVMTRSISAMQIQIEEIRTRLGMSTAPSGAVIDPRKGHPLRPRSVSLVKGPCPDSFTHSRCSSSHPGGVSALAQPRPYVDQAQRSVAVNLPRTPSARDLQRPSPKFTLLEASDSTQSLSSIGNQTLLTEGICAGQAATGDLSIEKEKISQMNDAIQPSWGGRNTPNPKIDMRPSLTPTHHRAIISGDVVNSDQLSPPKLSIAVAPLSPPVHFEIPGQTKYVSSQKPTTGKPPQKQSNFTLPTRSVSSARSKKNISSRPSRSASPVRSQRENNTSPTRLVSHHDESIRVLGTNAPWIRSNATESFHRDWPTKPVHNGFARPNIYHKDHMRFLRPRPAPSPPISRRAARSPRKTKLSSPSPLIPAERSPIIGTDDVLVSRVVSKAEIQASLNEASIREELKALAKKERQEREKNNPEESDKEGRDKWRANQIVWNRDGGIEPTMKLKHMPYI